jgi:hypothetical protein
MKGPMPDVKGRQLKYPITIPSWTAAGRCVLVVLQYDMEQSGGWGGRN